MPVEQRGLPVEPRRKRRTGWRAHPSDHSGARIAPMNREMSLEQTVQRYDVVVQEEQDLARRPGDRGVASRRGTAALLPDDFQREGSAEAGQHLRRAVRGSVDRDDDLERDPGPMLPVKRGEQPAKPAAAVVRRNDDADARVVAGSHAWYGAATALRAGVALAEA